MKEWSVENDSEKQCSWREDSILLRLRLWKEGQNASPSRRSEVPSWGRTGPRGEQKGWAVAALVDKSSWGKARTQVTAVSSLMLEDALWTCSKLVFSPPFYLCRIITPVKRESISPSLFKGYGIFENNTVTSWHTAYSYESQWQKFWVLC